MLIVLIIAYLQITTNIWSFAPDMYQIFNTFFLRGGTLN